MVATPAQVFGRGRRHSVLDTWAKRFPANDEYYSSRFQGIFIFLLHEICFRIWGNNRHCNISLAQAPWPRNLLLQTVYLVT